MEDSTQEIEYTPAEIEAQKLAEADAQAALEKTETAPTPTEEVPPAAAAYEPNFKFKVLDEEKEIDELFRPLIKDKDTEAKVKEIFEKAYGIDHIKSERESERTERARAEQQYQRLVSEIEDLGELKEKDLGLMFKKLGVSEQQLAAYILQRAEAKQAEENLPPHMKGLYTKNDELAAQQHELFRQVEAMKSERQAAALQARIADVNSTLSSPDIKPVADAYDARVGKPGAFRQLVCRHGSAEFEASGGKRDMSAAEAAREVVQMLGLQTTPAGQQPQSATKVVPPAKPVVLPNVGSGTATPTKTTPVSSLKELRDRAKKVIGG